jgi:signal transduction histidine kinase
MDESPHGEMPGVPRRLDPHPPRIVVIDDDYAMRLSCRQILAKSGYQVETFEDGAHGLDSILTTKPDLVVVDLKMPGISGMEVISRVKEIDPLIVIVVITGYPTIGSAVDAIKSGAFDFLPKPFTPDELRLVAKRALERRRLLLESSRLEFEREFLKRRFVTFVSHQLKTPLVAIHQYLEVLERMEDAPDTATKRREWHQRCLKRTDGLLAIIDDWLTLSEIETSDLARRRVSVNLGEILSGILDVYEELAAESDVELTLDLAEDPLLVRGDPNCVSVLFDNLIVNAIKYNRAGGDVRVSGERVGGEVIVAVSDTGVGIPEKYRTFLFDEFFRVGGDAARKTGGTGLGLPICKRIVSELGGKIEVESEEGVGSTFKVWLPVYRDDAGLQAEEEAAARSSDIGVGASK